jgi:hypothetical protein
MQPYTYKSSKDFINNLAFEYIETYSFQRGEIFEDQKKKNHALFQKLNTRKIKKNDLTAGQDKQLEELLHLGNTQFLISSNGGFHTSSNKINTFQKEDPLTEKLKNILRIESVNIPSWLCAPIYRDAIVFYNKKNEIVATLNICLSCQHMATKTFEEINGDSKTYGLLKIFFIEMGHEVESE